MFLQQSVSDVCWTTWQFIAIYECMADVQFSHWLVDHGWSIDQEAHSLHFSERKLMMSGIQYTNLLPQHFCHKDQVNDDKWLNPHEKEGFAWICQMYLPSWWFFNPFYYQTYPNMLITRSSRIQSRVCRLHHHRAPWRKVGRMGSWSWQMRAGS